ncbi:MAG TPA: T9SS type A sorting domain-containing protein, partial [Bacteroidia bacterium]|nr:T9SS type A sorting domain-containing protein [Bacteroidia bacterium]
EWVLLRDYNCDGKMDIFCYASSGSGGIRVYKNVSTIAGGLQFQLVDPLIMSDYYPNSSPPPEALWVTSVDIPAIRDIDHDGDMDVLTYDASGVHVEFHRNMSEEMGYGCDSLIYKLQTGCWGDFAEDPFNSHISLNDTCSPPQIAGWTGNSVSPYRMHNGSCMECINTDGDNDQDILIGDITNPYIVYGRNGGDSSFAKMDFTDPTYPSYDTPLNMNMFNAAFHLDVNNDGNKDVIFAPNAPNSSANFTSAWYYRNTGTTDSVVLTYVQDDFLQDNMIDVGEGAYPRFFDYDGDGDMDMFIGNYGYYASATTYPSEIAFYENTGSASSPSFTLVTRDFLDLHANSTGIICPVPTFGDVDGDGDMDMIVGDASGKLTYFRKDPGPNNNFVLVQTNYMGIDVGNNAAPQLVDVDRDGLPDLLIGEQSGNVNYYRNIGTATAPNFALVNNLFGGFFVNITGNITGYSVPWLWDNNGQYELLVGSERGYLYRFDNIDQNLSGNFTLTDSMYVDSYLGLRISPCVTFLNGDTIPDLVIGNYAGGVGVYLGAAGVGIEEHDLHHPFFSVYPDPAQNSLTIEIEQEQELSLPATFSIYSVNGQLLKEEKINSRKTDVDISMLAPGFYIATVETAGGRISRQKFVVRN